MEATNMAGRSIAILAAAGFLAACTGGIPEERTSEGLLLDPPFDGAGLQLSLHAPPGLVDEARRCHLVVMPAGGGEGTDVEALEHRLSDGAMEVRLSHTDLDIEAAFESSGLVLCDAVEQHAGPTAYASVEGAGGVSLPTGVALHFAPYEVVLLEARFGDHAGAAGDEARVNLWFSTTTPDVRTPVLPAGTASGDHE
jgi:hypothetical protein